MFKDNNVEEGYPRPVSDFGLPSGGVDAAFSWAHNDKTNFFKDQLYWRYDEHTRRMDPGHPAQSPPWRGVPSTLDDAMRWSDGEPGKGESLAASASPLWEWGCRGAPAPPPWPQTSPGPPWPTPLALVHLSPHPFLAPVTLPAVASSPLAATQTRKHAGTHPKAFAPAVLPPGTLFPLIPTRLLPHPPQSFSQTSLQRPLPAVRSTPPSYKGS